MPWLADAWRLVEGSMRAGRLTHALLIGGDRGVGKQVLAESLAHLLVCEQVAAAVNVGDNGGEMGLAPCGQCKQCELVAAESHPDIRRYAPEKSRLIKVDQIRALSVFAVSSPQVARRKVILVDRADQLNLNAANALLKTLEEPSDDVVLLLLQESGRPILPTLRSRCQCVTIATPASQVGLDWLELQPRGDTHQEAPSRDQHLRALTLAGSAPRLALEYLNGEFLGQRQDALDAFRRFMKNELSLAEAAKSFKTLGLEGTLWLMENWAADLARLGAGGRASDPDSADMLRYLATSNPPWRVHGLLQQLQEARAAGIYNVNPELEAERLLMAWQDFMPSRRRRAP
ncbi:DNA polymerase III subunit delta' C-terminal domain-containing protein [Marinobacter sp. SS21]|uniref:DNA polymerase III subunit delta' C-terminal domain-containing protein n=1 Tax=Marinobacter sp. SS21 TaxID=2979460 RepID=UPI002330E0C8|nr:DNA polymerase III subunit delta' [Marinobacter sp. SS21]MDC0661888.1 DNA polymerase III subunit delta' [Marinobacter sp. SS21]